LYEAIRERDEAELVLRTTKQKYDVGMMARPDLEAATIRLRRAEQRMDSSFSIARGETVVIGTSRLNGDQALIAILTAAAKPGRAR
jgi:hypothetical protein